MDFQYALVARGTTPLAEFSLVSGNHRSTALNILEKVDPKKPNSTFDTGGNTFFTLTDPDRTTFLVMCSSKVVRTLQTAFVQDLQRKWRSKYGNKASSFAPSSKNQEFGSTEINSLLKQYNASNKQKLVQVKQNLQEAQDKMNENLNTAFKRGEQLEIMNQKSESIRDSAQAFHRDATKLARQMCLQKYRWYIMGGAIAVVVIIVIVIIACGGLTFKKCKKSKKNNNPAPAPVPTPTPVPTPLPPTAPPTLPPSTESARRLV